MSVSLQCATFPLSEEQVNDLWKITIKLLDGGDDEVSLRCVSEAEIFELNKRYRGKDASTNILTFSYEDDYVEKDESTSHDIVISLEVASKEAEERDVEFKSYVALLVIHAFFHAVGKDHEDSKDEAENYQKLEQDILAEAGFEKLSL